MTSFNSLKFLTESNTQFNVWLERIDASETYEDACKNGDAALGFVDCMIVFMNSCVCTENNSFTEELDEVIEDWRSAVYQHMASIAISTDQDRDLIFHLLKKRDGEE